jgi:hypothetical protein
MKLLIICYVPEIGDKNNEAMKNIAIKIENAFKKASGQTELCIVKILDRNRNLVIKNLEEIADELSEPNKKAILYYYGHGDQLRDTSGDEKDGKDEIWQTQGIIDDEISKIFSNIHDSSSLYLFSDSCSSGSMIDEYYNKKDWVTISSCNDKQDSLATSDGGVFTLWGLIPALETLKDCTPKKIHDFIKNNIQISSQKSLLHFINEKTIHKSIFG